MSSDWLDLSLGNRSTVNITPLLGGGRITFNVDVAKLPPVLLDYVIAHEPVHLKIPNHSPAYWRLLGRVMPDWEKRRERLGKVEL